MTIKETEDGAWHHEPEDKRKPVIRGHASVVTTKNLVIRVLWWAQLKKVVFFLMKNNIHFEWQYFMGDGTEPDWFDLTIYDLPWANNLTRLAKMLESVDHRGV